jgi:hypothetical protein
MTSNIRNKKMSADNCILVIESRIPGNESDKHYRVGEFCMNVFEELEHMNRPLTEEEQNDENFSVEKIQAPRLFKHLKPMSKDKVLDRAKKLLDEAYIVEYGIQIIEFNFPF